MATPKSSPRLKPRPGDRRGPLSGRPGSSLWYGLVFLLLLVLAQAYYMTPTGKSVPYSEFKDLVKKGAVEEVTVGDQLIHGTLKEAAPADREGLEQVHDDESRRPEAD